MATVVKQVSIAVPVEQAWEAVRDWGAVHQRLCPGVLTDTVVEGEARIVTFANGLVAKELIVAVDDTARRLVWAVVGTQLLATTTPACRSWPKGRAAASSGPPTCCRTRPRLRWRA